LTDVIVSGAGAPSPGRSASRFEYQLPGHLTAANCGIFGERQWDRNVTPFLARTLTWIEAANGTSIVFDLRISAVAGKPEAETQGRFVAEAIRIVGAFLLELSVEPSGPYESVLPT
jgi:hypothetical protein